MCKKTTKYLFLLTNPHNVSSKISAFGATKTAVCRLLDAVLNGGLLLGIRGCLSPLTVTVVSIRTTILTQSASSSNSSAWELNLLFGTNIFPRLTACIIKLLFGTFDPRSTSVASPGPRPVVHPRPGTSCWNGARRWPAEEERASCHGQAGWELGRAAVAQELFPLISTSFICPPLSSLPPSLHPSIPSSSLCQWTSALSMPRFHCAQSAVAEQMASLCFFAPFLKDSEFKCSHMFVFLR